jgi:hypothetical protein
LRERIDARRDVGVQDRPVSRGDACRVAKERDDEIETLEKITLTFADDGFGVSGELRGGARRFRERFQRGENGVPSLGGRRKVQGDGAPGPPLGQRRAGTRFGRRIPRSINAAADASGGMRRIRAGSTASERWGAARGGARRPR